MSRKVKLLGALVIFPFAVIGVERLIIKPVLTHFPLPTTSIYMGKVGVITLLLLIFAALRGTTYGLTMPKKLGSVFAVLFALLIAIIFLFLFTLQTHGFFDSLAIIHVVNWIITVFREELILRGIIQTEAAAVLRNKYWGVSGPVWFTTFIFSVWHVVNLTSSPWQTVALQMLACIPSGILLGIIREKTGSTLLTYLLHIGCDLLFFSLYLMVFGTFFLTLF